MDHHVAAQRDRALKDGRHQRIVGKGQRPRRLGLAGAALEVGEAEERIARRLEPDQRRFPGQRRPESPILAQVDEIDADPATLRETGKEAMGAAVAIVRRHHKRACRQRQQGEESGGLAGAGYHSPRRTLELREQLGEHVAVRVDGA